MFNPRASRRQLLAKGGQMALGATALGAFLEACGSTSSASSNTQVHEWYFLDDTATQQYYLKTVRDAFNQAHPNVTLDVTLKPINTPVSTYNAAIESGKGPDIIYTSGPSQMVSYAQNGTLIPLDKYASADNWSSKVLSWALRTGKVNNKLYFLPGYYASMIIYYNKNVFAANGWTVPQTRDDLEAIATEAKAKGIIPFASGNSDWKPATEWFTTVFLNHYAGPDALYQALTGQIKFTDPVFVDAVTLQQKYFQSGWYAGGLPQYFTNTEAQFDALFGSGKAAMNMEGSWAFQYWTNYFGAKANNQNDWDWFPIPPLRSGVPTNVYTIGLGGSIGINARSTSPDASAVFMDWLYSTPQRIASAVADVGFSPYPVALQASDFPASTDPRLVKFYTDFTKATNQNLFGYTTWTFFGPKGDEWTYMGMDQLFQGQMTPKDFCVELDKRHTAELQSHSVPAAIPLS